MNRKALVIIGKGRFGSLLAEFFAGDFTLKLLDRDDPPTIYQQALAAADIIIPAVPISELTKVLALIAPLVKPGATVMDVCSVKHYPCQWLQKWLPSTVQCIGTHPLFGPDSFKAQQSLAIVMCQVSATADTYQFWHDYFTKRQLQVLAMTPLEHDEMMANSQSITHFIGRLLAACDIAPQVSATLGFKRLLAVKQQTENDSMALFFDLFKYNPYSQKVLKRLQQQSQALYQQLTNAINTVQL